MEGCLKNLEFFPFKEGIEKMSGYDTRYIFNFLEMFSPFVLYLILVVIIRIILEKISFLRKPPFESVFFFIKNLLHILIFIISLIVALGIFGIDVQGIITGLGLASFIMGFALKDVISNLLSGFSILFYGPFKIGDIINVDGTCGTVSKMDIHYIVLDTGNELCYIPNSYITGTKIMVKKHNIKRAYQIK